MDLHPLFVHFPVAFLSAYVALEVGIWGRWRVTTWWARAWLLWGGVGTGVIAALFGAAAEERLESQTAAAAVHELIERHEQFMVTALSLFGVLALAYLCVGLRRVWGERGERNAPWWLARVLAVTAPLAPLSARLVSVAPVLAAVAWMFLLVGGSYGAAIIHGPDADVIIRWALWLTGWNG